MIIGALLARNEAGPDRYLGRVLDNAASFVDQLIVVDDGSTDETAQVCRRAGAIVSDFNAGSEFGWWGRSEYTARAHLWDLAAKAAGLGGWIYVFDADHLLKSLTPSEFRILCQAEHVNSWAWPLYDLWDSEDTMRADGYWQAHKHPRPWLARAFPTPNYKPMWAAKALHAGHFPHNYPWQPSGLAPGAIRHLGYIKPEHRALKAERYLKA